MSVLEYPEVRHHTDEAYKRFIQTERKKYSAKEWTPERLRDKILTEIKSPDSIKDEHDYSRQRLLSILTDKRTNDTLSASPTGADLKSAINELLSTKGSILDSTSTTTGNALIRQDLEAPLIELPQ